jgi:hypothetical protein
MFRLVGSHARINFQGRQAGGPPVAADQRILVRHQSSVRRRDAGLIENADEAIE